MSAPFLAARCPAKVNLSLRVLRRRDDGYHEIDTVFQAIDLWDVVEGQPSAGLTLTCDQPGIPVDSTNLVLRAAELLRSRYEPAGGAALTLRKRIPAGAGLGGGSSDAAGALLLCARLWNLHPKPEEICGLARDLGADVPFFLLGGTARGRGRGDRIEPLPPCDPFWLLLGLAPFGISTADVFSTVGTRLTLPRNGVSVPLFSAHKWRQDNDFATTVNDLEEVVFERWPELARFRDALLSVGAGRALLSGSGSTVYGTFDGRDAAREAARRLASGFAGWELVPARAVNGRAHVVPKGALGPEGA